MGAELDSLLTALQGAAALFERLGAVAAYLFGSAAESVARPDSDVDIAMLLPRGVSAQERLARRFDLMQDLGSMLRRDVGVVVLNDAPLRLIGQVLRHGRVVYCADAGARVDFEVRALRLYFDLHAYDRAHDQALVRRIREGRLGERFRSRKDKSALAGARRVQEHPPGNPARPEE